MVLLDGFLKDVLQTYKKRLIGNVSCCMQGETTPNEKYDV